MNRDSLRRWIHRHGLTATAGLLIVAASVLYVQQSLKLNDATERVNEVTACQADYNEAVSESLKARAQSTEQERRRNETYVQVEQNTWATILSRVSTVPGDPSDEDRTAGLTALQQYRVAGDDYLKASRIAGAVRQDNPLPTLDCR